MKRLVTGGFLLMAGMIGLHGVILAAAVAPADGWSTPPGRFITTLMENGSIFLALPSLLLLAAGLILLFTAVNEKKP